MGTVTIAYEILHWPSGRGTLSLPHFSTTNAVRKVQLNSAPMIWPDCSAPERLLDVHGLPVFQNILCAVLNLHTVPSSDSASSAAIPKVANE